MSWDLETQEHTVQMEEGSPIGEYPRDVGLQLPGWELPAELMRSIASALLLLFPSSLPCFLSSSNERATLRRKSNQRDLLECLGCGGMNAGALCVYRCSVLAGCS